MNCGVRDLKKNFLPTEEAISKTARALEEADISEEKRDVIHREIGKFRESMKVLPPPRLSPSLHAVPRWSE